VSCLLSATSVVGVVGIITDRPGSAASSRMEGSAGRQLADLGWRCMAVRPRTARLHGGIHAAQGPRRCRPSVTRTAVDLRSRSHGPPRTVSIMPSGSSPRSALSRENMAGPGIDSA